MKVLRSVLAVILCISMLFFGIIGVCAVEISEAVHSERNWESALGYARMVESFGQNEITGEPIYPETYGGAYIDSNDVLVVQYVENVDNSEEILQKETDKQFSVSKVSEITGLSTVKTQPVQYSFNELVTANDIIGSFIPKLDAVTGKLKKLPTEKASLYEGEVVQTGIDPKNNRVVVWLADVSQESIDEFYKNISDAPFLEFRLAPEERPTFQVSYRSGEGSVNSDIQINGSIGFPATYGSETGFVTAWHCTTGGNNTINNMSYGVRIHGSESLDYAFVRQQNTSISISRELYGTSKSLNAGVYAFLIQGIEVGRTGQATGYQTGVVTEIENVNGLGDDLFATSCESAHGDSGGPYFGLSSTSTVSIAGIHIGAWRIGGINTAYCRGISYLYNAGYRIR